MSEHEQLDAAVAVALGWEVRDEYYPSDGEYAEQLVYDSTGEMRGGPGAGWSPSRKIEQAWEVHRAMCDRLFSTRQRYYRALQEAVAFRMGSFVLAWPDVISFLEPVDFCRAALAASAPASVETTP